MAQKRQTFVSESILIGSAKDGKAAIIEKSPEKTVLFAGEEKDRIICTNHYQSEAFSKDERNMENIRTSDSPYRFARLKELINENRPIDVTKAASILRNHKGLQNADLGLANEMAINQFIAHHSVIFQPERQIMWVSTSPWQCGKYVAYDLNKIFSDSIDFLRENIRAGTNDSGRYIHGTAGVQAAPYLQKADSAITEKDQEKRKSRRQCIKKIRSFQSFPLLCL